MEEEAARHAVTDGGRTSRGQAGGGTARSSTGGGLRGFATARALELLGTTDRGVGLCNTNRSGGGTARGGVPAAGHSTARGVTPRGSLMEPDFVIAARAQTARELRTRPLPAGMPDPMPPPQPLPMPGMPGLPPACGLPPQQLPYGMYGAGGGCSPACGLYGPAGGAFGGMGGRRMPDAAAPLAACAAAARAVDSNPVDSVDSMSRAQGCPRRPPQGLRCPAAAASVAASVGQESACPTAVVFLPSRHQGRMSQAAVGGPPAQPRRQQPMLSRRKTLVALPTSLAASRCDCNAAALARAAARKTEALESLQNFGRTSGDGAGGGGGQVSAGAAGGSRSPRRSCGSVAESAGEASTDSGDEAWPDLPPEDVKQKV